MLFIREKLRQKQYEVFISPHVDNLYRFARRLCQQNEDAEDITQDLLIKLYPQFKKLNMLDNPKPYLSRALYNQFIDFKRRQGKHITFVDSEVELDSLSETTDNTPEITAEQGLSFNNITAAMDAIPDNHRVIIVMHDMEGYTFDEISNMLDIPKGTAKSRLHRARAALKSKL